MQTSLAFLGLMVVPLFMLLWIGGPMVLADWIQSRREEAIRRQIALTDAIDRRLGAIVSPVVRQSLWGPWQIRIAVPFTRPTTVGTALAVAHEVLSVVDRMNPGRYQIILTPQKGLAPGERESRAAGSGEGWPGDNVVAA